MAYNNKNLLLVYSTYQLLLCSCSTCLFHSESQAKGAVPIRDMLLLMAEPCIFSDVALPFTLHWSKKHCKLQVIRLGCIIPSWGKQKIIRTRNIYIYIYKNKCICLFYKLPLFYLYILVRAYIYVFNVCVGAGYIIFDFHFRKEDCYKILYM